MKTVIEMAREAGFEAYRGWGLLDHVPEDVFAAKVNITREIERFAELVRADERKSRAHTLGPGEMELSLRRNHRDALFECRRRFSAEEVILGPDFMVEATASNLEVEMDRAIRARGNT